jgi:hypothetical protein
MNKASVLLLALLACGCSRAPAPPAVGVVEQLAVMPDTGMTITARPIYIMTDRALAAPTTFSALQSVGTKLEVVCCYEVADTTPLSLATELEKYGSDREFAAHMQSVRGHRYLYAARPSADRTRWTPLMKAFVKEMADPNDGVPVTNPVIAAQFDRSMLPAAFDVAGTPVRLHVDYDRKAARMVYDFDVAGSRVRFSEDGFPD